MQKRNRSPAAGAHPGATLLARRILDLAGRFYSGLFYSTEVHGLENVPSEGPVLLLAKHQSVDDIPLGVSHVLFRRRWSVWAVMKDSLAAPIFFDFFLKCGGIPLNRTDPRRSKRFLLHARKVLHGGDLVAIFPEQTTVPGEMGRGRTGAFRFIAGKPEAPIPVVCMGYEYRRRGFLRRTRVILRAGEPRPFTSEDDPDTFLHECMHEIARLANMVYPFEKESDGPVPAVSQEGVVA